MTRKEQIKAFAQSIGCADGSCGYVVIAKAVEWADTHPQWIPVEEELPKMLSGDNSYRSANVFFVTDDNKGNYGYYTEFTGFWVTFDNVFKKEQVTHWMQLPTPPRKED